MSTVIDVPPQTTGDGTSAGPLSVFARGWNGYLNTLRGMHPDIQFREGCLDVSGRFRGDLSLREVNDQLLARVKQLEAARPDQWLPKSMTVADIAERASKAEAKVDELEADKTTLDWLEVNMVGTGHGGKVLMTVSLPMLPTDDYEKPTLRAAVAEARKGTS